MSGRGLRTTIYACTNTYNFQYDYFLLIFAGSMKIRLWKKKKIQIFYILTVFNIKSNQNGEIYVQVKNTNQNTILHQC